MSDRPQASLSFGPFGVSVCDGAYAVFRRQQQNSIRIELSGDAIRGIRTHGLGPLRRRRADGPPAFAIPYTAISAVTLEPHPAHTGLQQVLEIRYVEDGVAKAKSIAAFDRPARAAYAILKSLRRATP
jgi:hypothetical protein